MGKVLESSKVAKINAAYFENLNVQQSAEKSVASVGAVHTYQKSLEEEVKSAGLLPVLEKYKLNDAKQVAQLNATLIHNHTTAEECFRAIPLARKFAAGHISYEAVESVVDQVFSTCPPELAQQFGSAIVEYAQERAKNGNLTVGQLRAEYETLTGQVNQLNTKHGTLTTQVNGLETEKTQLRQQISKLTLEEKTITERLAREQQTDVTLQEYTSDRSYLYNTLGVDIRDVPRTRSFFQELGRLGFNVRVFVGLICAIPSLTVLVQNLRAQVQTLSNRITELGRKYTEAEGATRDALQRATNAETDANARIEVSNKLVKEKLAQNDITLKDIEDTNTLRQELRKAGLEP